MIEKHQIYAVLIYLLVIFYLVTTAGFEQSISRGGALLAILLLILFYRTIAYFSGWGFPEVFARDYGSENNPGPYAFFFWLLFIIGCVVAIFT